jgi:transposase
LDAALFEDGCSRPGCVDTFRLAEKGPHMGRKNRPRAYPAEFRLNIIDLARAGRSVDDLASEFKLGTQTIRNWLKQADLDRGRRSDGLTSVEREELSRLRKENKQLRIEREILGKAAAWFARETDSIPPRSSNS